MKGNILLSLFFFQLVISAEVVHSQTRNVDSVSSDADNSEPPVDLNVRQQKVTISADSIFAYKREKDFAYVVQLDSLLKTVIIRSDTFQPDESRSNKFNKQQYNNISKQRIRKIIPDSPLLRIFFWLIASSVILLVVYKLFINGGFFKKEGREIVHGKTINENLIENAQYESLIQEAIHNKSYTIATRYMFLQVLQKLNTRGMIKFTRDKTNSEYVRELKDKPYQQQFSRLILHYEYVWYGRSAVSKEKFDEVKKDFDLFNNKV